jgi:hypothetical protein
VSLVVHPPLDHASPFSGVTVSAGSYVDRHPGPVKLCHPRQRDRLVPSVNSYVAAPRHGAGRLHHDALGSRLDDRRRLISVTLRHLHRGGTRLIMLPRTRRRLTDRPHVAPCSRMIARRQTRKTHVWITRVRLEKDGPS